MLWEDLKRNPEHVWTLELLTRTLRAQEKTDELKAVEARLATSRTSAATIVQ